MRKESQNTKAVKGKGNAFHDPFAHEAYPPGWVEAIVVLAAFVGLER